MADIFLSYAGEDRETAGKLAQCFEATGLTVWWDRKIPAGMTWRQVIEKSLNDMACMVVLWSTSSIDSAWVNEEAEEGRARDKLVPVLIEPVVPPLGFRGIQAADLTTWDGSADAPGLRQLLADLEARLGRLSRTPATAAASKTPTTAPAPQPTRRKLPPAVAATSLVLLAVVAWLWYAGQPQNSAEPARTRPETASAAKATAAAPASEPAAPISPPTRLAEPVASGSPSLKPPTTGAAAGGTATVTRSTRPEREFFPRDARPARCRDLLERQGLGDPLSAEDRSFVHKECRS